MKRLSFIILLCSLFGGLFGQELDSLHGIVVDEEGVGVANVALVVNGKEAKSNKYGYFNAGPTNDPKIHHLEAKHPLYTLRSWGILNRRDGIEVRMKGQRGIKGMVLDSKKQPVPRVAVQLTKPIAFGPVYTNNGGSFAMDLPTGTYLDHTAKFSVNGQALPNSAVSFDETYKKVTLLFDLPAKQPTVSSVQHKGTSAIRLQDQQGQAIAHGAVMFGGKGYIADKNGVVRLPIEGDLSNLALSLEDYALTGELPADANGIKPYVFVLEKDFEAMGKNADPRAKLAQDSNAITSKYGTEFSSIFNALHNEREQLASKSDSLRSEITRVVGRLQTEKGLSEQETQSLTKYLIKLEQELIASNEALRSVQKRTEASLLQMREALYQKDSLNVLANQTIEKIEHDKEEVENELHRDILIFFAVAASLLAMTGMFFFFARRARRQKAEVEVVNANLQQTQARLEATLLEVRALNDATVKQNQKITNSIRYAQTIQQAILPTKAMMDAFFTEYFIMYRPKEIVSGDFYWAAEVPAGVLMASIDCTGHGVPGGFMSMIGHSLLSDIVYHKAIYNPAEILEQLNEGIRGALKQDQKINEDGMDICLCLLEKQADGQTKVAFSGAMRPLYYVENGKIKQLKGDLKSAGGLQRKANRPFTNQTLMLPSGSMLYFTSDGISDQHNPQQEKLGTRRLMEIFEEIASMPARKQQQALEHSFDAHKQHAEQRDDVMVVGVKL